MMSSLKILSCHENGASLRRDYKTKVYLHVLKSIVLLSKPGFIEESVKIIGIRTDLIS